MPVPRDEENPLDSGELGAALRALRDDLCIDPAPDVKSAHLAAMDLAGSAPGECDATALHPKAPRRRRLRALALPIAATVGVLGLTCGLAVAGELPGPAQRQASRLARAVGWEVPENSGPSNDRPDTRPGGTPGPPASTSTSPAAPGESRPGASDGTGLESRTPDAVPGPAGPTGPAAPSPGNSDAAPGQGGNGSTTVAPGKSGAAPGHAGSGSTTVAPGKSGAAPGQSGSAPGRSGATPGNSGNAPGRNKG
jgi:hypothetical protein